MCQPVSHTFYWRTAITSRELKGFMRGCLCLCKHYFLWNKGSLKCKFSIDYQFCALGQIGEVYNLRHHSEDCGSLQSGILWWRLVQSTILNTMVKIVEVYNLRHHGENWWSLDTLVTKYLVKILRQILPTSLPNIALMTMGILWITHYQNPPKLFSYHPDGTAHPRRGDSSLSYAVTGVDAYWQQEFSENFPDGERSWSVGC